MADSGNSRPQQIGINAYAPRRAFIELHNRRQRWAVIVAHRRAGKTVACVADLVLSALICPKQDGRFAYIAPQYNQAKDVAWLYVKRLTADIPGISYNEAELRANLPNGAQVRLYGADNPDRLRGLYLDGVILDEYADMKPRVWGEIVRPLLTDRKGWAAFIGTPKGHNEFYEIWRYAQLQDDWLTVELRASSSGLLDDAELKDARRSMSADQYEQEFECSFEAAIAGAYYGREMRQMTDEGRIKRLPIDPYTPVHTAWDLGFRDDTAIWWYQVVRGEVRVIDFHSSSGEPVKYYGELIRSKPYKYGTHYLPHDARAKTLASGGRSIIEQLSEYLEWKSLSIVPELSIQDGIQAVRLMLPRTWIDSGCGEGIEALRQYQREFDEDKKVFRDKPRHDWTSHAADAFRMLAIAWKEEAKPEAPKPEPIKGLAVGPANAMTLNEAWKSAPRSTGRI